MRDDEGVIETWSTERATVRGLAWAAQGEVVEIVGTGLALITALWQEWVEVAPLTTAAVAAGMRVRLRGPLAVPVGEAVIGRAIDGVGRARDGGGATIDVPTRPIFARDRVVPTAEGASRLTLGSLVHDLQCRLSVGATHGVRRHGQGLRRRRRDGRAHRGVAHEPARRPRRLHPLADLDAYDPA